ncbi:MAG TPA: nucleotide exchange factor GrpE [Pirellulales bacterium]|nr:nucleotide exchange factor GrpE [Pirellulales bacterium]
MTDAALDEPFDDQLLARFGRWLRATRSAEQLGADGSGEPAIGHPREPGQFGLYRLVEEFTSLRHEVKLQTKSARAADASSEQLVAALKQAIEALRTVEPREAQAAWAAGKSFALALAELDEALDRGRRQTEQAAAALIDGPRDELLARLDAFHRRSWWRKLCHGGYFRELRGLVEREQQRPPRAALLEALVDGYRLIQKRLVQTLAAEEIVRIPTESHPVDPEQMVVVEVVDVDDRPAGLVYDELRRGYTWKGRILRYAEVRATRRAPVNDIEH